MRAEIPIVVLDYNGSPIAGAVAAVYQRDQAVPVAVYAHPTGSTSIPNPLVADDAGRVTGWVERGQYDVVISHPGLTTYTEPFDAAPAGDGGIDTAWLADSVVTAAKLAPGAVTDAKVMAGTGIQVSKLAPGNVGDVLKTVLGSAVQWGTVPPVAARVASTVAGFGSPLDGAMGLVRCGSSPFDFVSLIYDATYGKWVSEEFPLAIGPTNSAGLPIGAGLTTWQPSWPQSLTNTTTNDWNPVKNYAAMSLAGLTLQMMGSFYNVAIDPGSVGTIRLGIAFAAFSATAHISKSATWTAYVGPSSPAASTPGGGIEFDWVDVNTTNFPGMTPDYWGRLQLMGAGQDGTHRVAAEHPVIYGRWVG